MNEIDCKAAGVIAELLSAAGLHVEELPHAIIERLAQEGLIICNDPDHPDQVVIAQK